MTWTERPDQRGTAGAVAGRLPGIAAAARLPDGTVVEAAAGVRGLDNPAPMTPETVFWMASFTKAVTTAAEMQLVEAGRVELDAPAARWLPGTAAPKVLTGFDAAGAPQLAEAQAWIGVRQDWPPPRGLGYDGGGGELARYGRAVARAARRSGSVPLVFEPGSGWTYGVGLNWAGELVAAVAAETLDVYLAEHVFRAARDDRDQLPAGRGAGRSARLDACARRGRGAGDSPSGGRRRPTLGWAAAGSIPRRATT